MHHRSTTPTTRMGPARARAGAGSLIGKAVKNLRPSPAKIAKRKLTRKSNFHELLDGSSGFFVSRSAGNLFERNYRAKTRAIRFPAGVGGEGREPARDRNTAVTPKNEPLRRQLMITLETFLFDRAIGVRDMNRVEGFVTGEQGAREDSI